MEESSEHQSSQALFTKRRYNFWIIGSTVTLLFLFGVVGYILGNTSGHSGQTALVASPTGTPPPTMLVTQTELPGNSAKWNMYTDASDSFMIGYPDKLQYNFDTNANAPVALLQDVPTILFSSNNVSSDDHSANIIMIRVFKKNNTTMDMAEHNYFGKLDTTWKKITIGTYTGQVTNALDYNSGKQTGLVALVSINNAIYYFHLSQPATEQNITQQDFYHMLATFKTI